MGGFAVALLIFLHSTFLICPCIFGTLRYNAGENFRSKPDAQLR